MCIAEYAWLKGDLGGENDLSEDYSYSVQRIWVLYRNPFDDGHRQGVGPPFNPFETGKTPLGDWLAQREDKVLLQQAFNGVTVLLVDTGDEFVKAEQ